MDCAGEFLITDDRAGSPLPFGKIRKPALRVEAGFWITLRTKVRGPLFSKDRLTGGAELVTGLLHAIAETLLASLEIRAWVVGFLVADFAVDFKHPFDVLADVGDDGAGEGVLGVGIDVHFDDTIVERFLEVVGGGAGTTVEDEVHFRACAVLVHDGFLAVLEDGWLEFHRARLVGAVNVSEGGCEDEATDRLKCFVDFNHVLRGGIEFFDREAGGIVAVLFATNAAGFDFEDDAELGTFLEEFLGDFEVFIELNNRAIEHVGLEKRALAGGDALAGSLQQRLEETFDLGRVAVIGVERDEHIVFLGEHVAGLGKHDGSEGSVFHCRAGSELAAAGGNLDNSVGFRFGKGFESTVDRGERGDVDRRISVTAFLGGIEHGGILFRSCDRHKARWVADCVPGRKSVYFWGRGTAI